MKETGNEWSKHVCRPRPVTHAGNARAEGSRQGLDNGSIISILLRYLSVELEGGEHDVLLEVAQRALLAEVSPAEVLAALGRVLGLERVVHTPEVLGEDERAPVLVDALALLRGVPARGTRRVRLVRGEGRGVSD